MVGQTLLNFFGFLDDQVHGFIPRSTFKLAVLTDKGIVQAILGVDRYPSSNISFLLHHTGRYPKKYRPVQTFGSQAALVDSILDPPANADYVSVLDTNVHTTTITNISRWLIVVHWIRGINLLERHTCTNHRRSAPSARAPRYRAHPLSLAIRPYREFLGNRCL